MSFDPSGPRFALGGILLDQFSPLIDGAVPGHRLEEVNQDSLIWALDDDSRFTLTIAGDVLSFRLDKFAGERRLDAIGLRIGRASNVRQYLRNGYMSWDGSYFVQPDAASAVVAADPSIATGHAMTALLPQNGSGAVVLGFLRHDRYQSRFRFHFADGPLSIDVETLLDRKPFVVEIVGERLMLFASESVEPGLRRWARAVANAAPVSPRLPDRRITGWCSWYNLYASLSEKVLLEHLEAAARFRDAYGVPFDIFQIDDGFTPEMGDWLDFRPQFPNGLAPVMQTARERDFAPGLWIAPFMVGNRSQLFADHPDWVVRSRKDRVSLAPMTFYGEFRWHKRSEEYYVLDITHPGAEAYMRKVFRTWAKDWGCGYFKADFLHLGSIYGPEEAQWHEPDLSRMEVWMRMMRLIREEIGDALLLCCGSPLWAPIGYADAMRIGRDVGVSWTGHYSAQSLLRDQTARNFANGILWQADPDCILLRDRFHELNDDQVRSLAGFAGLAGGIVMTSDQLDEVPEPRRRMLADILADARAFQADFPELGASPLRYSLATGHTGQPMAVASADPVLVQRVIAADGAITVNAFNTGDKATSKLLAWHLFGADTPRSNISCDGPVQRSDDGIHVTIGPYRSLKVTMTPPPK